MAEIALSVAAKIAAYLVAPVSRPFRYLWNYKSNFENLENEVKKLKGRRDTTQHLVDDARRKGEEIEKHVESWLDNVTDMIDEASKVVEDDQKQANMQCFKCPNLKKRHQHSKKAAGKLKDVVRLQREAEVFKKVSYRTIPEETWLQSSSGYEAFESRELILKNTIDTLSNPDVYVVGIYGMGGVGKTTLAKEVARQVEGLNLFNEIVFAEVSDTPDIGEIGDKLGLEFREETISGRARRLCERLKKEEKIFVVLDNIWGSIDLEKIGIPLYDNHKGCKLLLTTRSRDVLTNKMDSQINFYIEVLDEDDAWKLFKRTAGACSELPNLQSVARDVAKACAGVPIAIVTVAKALKDKGASEWNKALRELRRPSPESFEGVTSEVYLSIQLSYNHLETEELKSLFLLCGTMACIYNFSVRDLLRYGMGLGLFVTVQTMEEALDNVDALVSKLKASSLLLNTSNGERFAIHDVVRDVAKSIALRDHHMFTVTDTIPRNWAHEDRWKSCAAISLQDITMLPQDLLCPQLKFFYAKSKDSFQRVPDNFFLGMPKLQVLHLVKMDLCSLPTSLNELINLQTLCFDQCKLGDIAIIGDLKKLEILSLRESNIKKLSREIHKLTMLRLLDLSDCSKLSVIPPNVLSSFTQLEALYMGNTSFQWEVERPNITRSNASLDELKYLCHLTTLEVQIPDIKMSQGLLSPKLERYKILIGDRWYEYHWHSQCETTKNRILKLNLNTKEDEVISQLKRIKELELYAVPDATNVLYDLDGKGFPELMHLRVKDNSHFLYIVDSKQSVSCDPLPILEEMSLFKLINLEKICNSSLGAKSFLQLRTIRVGNCEKLINIFSFSIDIVLPKLQEIDVSWCKNMIEIFAIGGEDVNNNEVIHKIQVNQLRNVTLRDLPKLKSFCHKAKAPSALQLTSNKNAQEIISEDELCISMSLFDDKVALPNLETLKISEMYMEKIWTCQHPSMSSCVQNLASLIIKYCDNLKELFSSSLVDSFVQLQYLRICYCSVLKEIIVGEELREEERISFPQLNLREEERISFPQLNFLQIKDLTKLRRLYSENYIEFSLLKTFMIQECPELKHFIFDEKVGFPSLEEMYISYMDELRMIWHNQLDENSFRKLKSLHVHDCKKLLIVFPLIMSGRISRLEYINVSSSGSIEEIFDLHGINFEERHSIEETLLRKLCIHNLPNLKHIWNVDPRGKLSFANLQTLQVSRCRNLKHLFPASVARGLSELKCLSVSDCGVEVIVAREEVVAEESTVRFIFPKLTSLKLRNLPELRTFYPGRHTIEGPVLQNLELYLCGNVRVFLSEGQHDIPTQVPLLLIEKVFPCLEELNLVGKNITMMWQGQIPERPLHKLKILEIGNDESTVLPLGIIQSFHSLEMFSLSSCSYKEIFSYEEAETQERTPTKIKKLVLKELDNLNYMWKQDSKLDFILQNLEVLQVICCDRLINLMSPSASLENLTILEVQNCKSLTNMVTLSAAKSLVQLSRMSILNCEKITEVIGNQGETTEDKLVFNKLKSLSLQFLPKLTSFCFGNSALEFPSLEELTMKGCPRMKSFSQGVLSTPTLLEVKINWTSIELSPDGDLNKAIRQFHEKTELSRVPQKDCSSSSSRHLERTHSV